MESAKKAKPRKKMSTISGFGLPARGATGVREHHRTNVEKLFDHCRAQIPIEEINGNLNSLFGKE